MSKFMAAFSVCMAGVDSCSSSSTDHNTCICCYWLHRVVENSFISTNSTLETNLGDLYCHYRHLSRH